VFLLVLSVIGLMLWPVKPCGAPGSTANARMMAKTLGVFRQAIQNRNVISRIVTEAEVNGYLAEALKKNGDASSSRIFGLGVREINVAFTGENFIVLVLANWGFVPLSYEITAVPSWKNGRLEAVVQKARWGHLSLPRFAAGWISRQIAERALRTEKDLEILNSLGRFDLGKGGVHMATRGR
jgi:hypothetical protein